MKMKRDTLELTLLFFFYCYIYSMVLSMSGSLASEVLDADRILLSYKLTLLFNGLGMVVFGLYRSLSRISLEAFRKIIGIVTLLTIPLIMLVFTTSFPLLFIASACGLTFLIGGECVYIYMQMIGSFSNRKHTGLMYFFGASLAILSQYVLQTAIGNRNYILYNLLLFSFITALLELLKLSNNDISETEAYEASEEQLPRALFRNIIITICIIICLEVIGNFLSYSLILYMPNGTQITYATPRFFVIFAYLIMGIFAEIRDMKYVPLITLCGVILGTLNPVLFNNASFLYMNTSIFYVVAGVINCFLTFYMWKLARGHRFLPLIAVLGRVIDCAFTIIFVSPFLSELPLPSIIALELFIVIIIMLLMAFSGQLDLSRKVEKDLVVKHIPPEEFAAKYGFSEKETEVFLSSLEHSGNMSELAKSIYISRTVLYKHINKMCTKTGVDNLQEIKKLYYKTGNSNEALSPLSSNVEVTIPQTEKIDNDSEKVEDTQVATKTIVEDKIDSFAEKYNLSKTERKILATFLENPSMTQKEIADQECVTLRTVQRHLASIRNKTGVKSLPELNKLFYEQ